MQKPRSWLAPGSLLAVLVGLVLSLGLLTSKPESSQAQPRVSRDESATASSVGRLIPEADPREDVAAAVKANRTANLTPAVQEARRLVRGTGAVSGTVVRDEDKLPLTGARVASCLYNRAAAEKVELAFVQTGNDGRFSIVAPAESQWIEFSAPDRATVWRRVSPVLRAEPIVVALEKAVSVAGTVVSPANHPVAGARVVVRRARRERRSVHDHESFTTDALGRFLATGLERAYYQFRVDAQGYATTWSPIVRFRQRDRETCQRITIRLLPAGRISGWVQDEAGLPILDARVTANSRDPRRRDRTEHCRVSSSGYFEFGALATGTWHLAASLDGGAYPDTWVEVVVPANGHVDGVTLRMPRGLDIEGLVVLQQPDASEDAGRQRLGRIHLWLVASNTDHSVRVDDRGRFRFRNVPPGSYRIQIDDRSRFGIVEGGEAEAGDRAVRLVVAPATGRIRGVVVGNSDLSRFPWVSLYSEGENIDSLRFDDATGQFETRALPPGSFQLRFQDADGTLRGLSEVVELRAGEIREGVELRVLSLGSVEGVVVDHSGVPLAGAVVALGTPDPQPYTVGGLGRSFRDLREGPETTTDSGGRFLLTRLPPGFDRAVGQELLVQLGKDVTQRFPYDPRGNAGPVRLVLPVMFDVEGVVREADGSAVSRIQVMLSPLDSLHPPRSTGWTDTRGRYQLSGVSAGTWLLRVRDFHAGLIFIEDVTLRDDTRRLPDIVLR